MNWNINEDFIFGFSETTNLNNIKKIYIFDLDNTIIKTKSNKKFPIDNNDWTWFNNDIPTKINSLENTINGIITNQRGLKSDILINNWIDKINNIIKKININFIFASIKHDKYSKPLTASWDFIINKLLFSININKLIDSNKIYYIGDAAGRYSDFSDTDIKYALNNKFRFKTPEQFLKINKKSINVDLNYPNFKYFTIKEQNNIFNNLFEIISSQKKVFIMLIGFPASGKSFLRNEIINKFPKFKYINNDDSKNNLDNKNLISKNYYDHSYIIDDNTNMNSYKRYYKLNTFKFYYKIGIFFDYDINLAFHLNYVRMFWYSNELIPKVTFYTLKKYFNNNDIDKNFNTFITIDKVFHQLNYDDKMKYYY